MTRTWHLLILLLPVSISLMGCQSVYTEPSGSPPSQEYVSNDTPERTWDAVVDFFASNNIRVHNEIKGESVWTIYAEQPEFKGGYLEEYVDLGTIDGEPVTSSEGETGVTIIAAATYNVTMYRKPEGQRLVVNTTWGGTFSGPGKNPLVPGPQVFQLKGVSKGRLEEEVRREIRRRLREMRADPPAM